MNIERDKYLTEAMGECWHDLDFSVNSMAKCSKCGVMYSCRTYSDGLCNLHDFSTWEGFGKLWEWCQKQEWWVGYLADGIEKYIAVWDVHPDRFADAVYEFLNEREK